MYALPADDIRVFVDDYHDSGAGMLRRSLAGGPLQVTICRETLKWSVLKRYHVAIIDATAPAPVSANELKAVKRFVSDGGGLLVAGCAPAYELVTDAPVSEMPAARIADLFGVGFVGGEDAAGDARYERDFRLSYPEESVVSAGDVIDGFGPNPPGGDVWAPLDLPEGTRLLLQHGDTAEALAAVAEHGAGRVCAVGSDLERFNVLSHLYPLIRWLAGDTTERPGRDIPTEIGPARTKQQVHGLTLICEEAIADRAQDLAAVVRRFDEFMVGIAGDDWKTPKRMQVRRTCQRLRPWDHDLFLAPVGDDWAVAYNVAFSIMLHTLWHSHYVDLIVGLFPEGTLARYVAIRFLEHVGFEEAADRLRGIALQMADQADPSGREGDLARIYWATEQTHPKGLWLLMDLERHFGPDFLRRLFEVIPKKREDDKLPPTWAWGSDRLAYYLGLAVGEDLTEELEEIGTLVHPLPRVSPDDDGFDAAMRSALADELLVSTASTSASRRMEALTDLSRIKPDDRVDLPERVRGLTEAFERSVASDVRAVEPLEALASGDDPSQAAWAALQLVSMGRQQWADRLAELLPDQDLRFRLMAGHTLRKIGREAPEGSLDGLAEIGRNVGELDVAHRDMLLIHPKVEGYEVANVLAESGLSGFPHGNWATRFYIDWVHTSPQWRRSGLSRLAFRAAMEHEEAQRCSCFALNTGTRNSAHALYREFGYVDMDRREKATRRLCLGAAYTPPDGVLIRPVTDDDREGVRRFLIDYHEDSFMLSPPPVAELGEGTFTAIAERDGTLIGAALARYSEGD
ncbi:MAG: hypothetical protein GF393_03865, partial [Armatimonadia bacterium]|nr:hypothetical protein [Armatimonadia bacterium]